jgi:hypothetical protein
MLPTATSGIEQGRTTYIMQRFYSACSNGSMGADFGPWVSLESDGARSPNRSKLVTC